MPCSPILQNVLLLGNHIRRCCVHCPWRCHAAWCFADEPPSLQGVPGQLSATAKAAPMQTCSTAAVTVVHNERKGPKQGRAMAKGFFDKKVSALSVDIFRATCRSVRASLLPICVMGFKDDLAQHVRLHAAASLQSTDTGTSRLLGFMVRSIASVCHACRVNEQSSNPC